jgi:hypothetical protein
LSPAEEAQFEEKQGMCAKFFGAILVGIKVLIYNPCTRLLLLGNLTLSISQFIFSYSLTTYFNFYHKGSTFALVNAFCVMFGGCTSCLAMGVVANKLDQRVPIFHRAKSIISATMCLIAVPLTLLLFSMHPSFPFSCSMLFMYDLLCLGYYAPVMSMIQGTVPAEQKGAAIGAFGFANNYI